jgi:hypothetical protein
MDDNFPQFTMYLIRDLFLIHWTTKFTSPRLSTFTAFPSPNLLMASLSSALGTVTDVMESRTTFELPSVTLKSPVFGLPQELPACQTQYIHQTH